MYASLGLIENSKKPGSIMGTHQKLDKVARRVLSRYYPGSLKNFPGIERILYFEGIRGPDGIKRKSPGVDDPDYFIEPGNDDGVLFGLISDHQYNLARALFEKDEIRAAFEAAWLAHSIVDGLTPAHHYPYRRAVDELMSDKDYKELFGVKIKGIMRGDNLAQAIRNNWLYWGTGGVMTKHVAFEFGVVYTIAPVTLKSLMPEGLHKKDFLGINYKKEFYSSLDKVANLKLYDRFLEKGWTPDIVMDVRNILIPEIVRAVAIIWASSLEEARKWQEEIN